MGEDRLRVVNLILYFMRDGRRGIVYNQKQKVFEHRDCRSLLTARAGLKMTFLTCLSVVSLCVLFCIVLSSVLFCLVVNAAAAAAAAAAAVAALLINFSANVLEDQYN